MSHDSHRKSVHIIMILLLSMGFYALRTIPSEPVTSEAGQGLEVVGSSNDLEPAEQRTPGSAISSKNAALN